jgi:hypothetical protein
MNDSISQRKEKHAKHTITTVIANNTTTGINNKNKRSKRELCGTIYHLSPIIEYTNGHTIYIHIISSNDNNDYYIALTGKQCLLYTPILTVGSVYTFKNIERSDSIVDSMTKSSNNNDLSNYWLIANDKCEIKKHVNNIQISQFNIDVFKFDQLLHKYPDFLEPSISAKIIYENMEISIRGYIDEICQNGVIKIIKSSIFSCENERNRANGVQEKFKNNKDNTFNIFLTSNHVKSYDLTKGDSVTCFSMFPMYLWGTFVGFAASIRSNIKIDSGDNFKISTTKGNSTSYCVNNKCPLITAWIFHLYQIVHSVATTAFIANKILETHPYLQQLEIDFNERRGFTDVYYAQLYFVRSGHDSDGLSSKLPLLWTSSKIMKLLSLNQLHFDSIRSVRSWKVGIIKNPSEKSKWEIRTGMSRHSVLVANIVEVISPNSPTMNCTVLRICSNKESFASMITIIVGDETGLRKLNEVFLLPAQISQRKILIEKFTVLFEVQPVELDESLKISMDSPTFILARAENVKIICEDNKILNCNVKAKHMCEQQMYSVRHALMRRPHCAEIPLPMLVGIVIQKVLIGNTDCYLLLRDLVDCDTMSISMKACEAKNIISGLIISIKNSKIYSISDDVTYKYDSEIETSSIDIIGIDPEQFDVIDNEFLQRFPIQSYYSCTSNVKIILPRLPPRYRLSTLYMTKSFNRCTWTFIGQVTFVRMFGASLKCQKCSATYKSQHVPFECKVCRGRHLFPTWEAEVMFDDGSGECRLFVEGDDVFKLLEPECLQMRNKLLRLKGIVEKLVYMHGSIIYTFDSILINREKKESREWSEDTFSTNAFDSRDEYQHLIETTDWTYNFIHENDRTKKTKNDEDAIDAIKAIRNIQKMRPIIEICAKIKGKTNQKPYLRTIKLQEDNAGFKFNNNQVTKTTLTYNHIEMICYSVKAIESNDTITEAYQILSKLRL